jgi:UDP-N-acetyl-2-amino-2-deoxyglucuronate dehydrogenase
MTTAAVIDASTVHLGAIAVSPDIDLAAVCDTDPGRLAAAVASLGVPGFADHVPATVCNVGDRLG